MYKFMNDGYGVPMNLQLFAGEADNDGDGAGDGDDQDDEESDEGGEETVEEKAQRMADAIVAKKLKKMPTKEELKAYRDWKTTQKPDGETEETPDVKARKEAEGKATSLEVKVACFEADVAKESVDDVAALARAYMAADGELDLEDAIEKVVKKYPQFKKGAADPYEEDGTAGKGSWAQRQSGKGSKKIDSVEAAFLAKNPGLKID